jgi:hypothetical protein
MYCGPETRRATTFDVIRLKLPDITPQSPEVDSRKAVVDRAIDGKSEGHTSDLHTTDLLVMGKGIKVTYRIIPTPFSQRRRSLALSGSARFALSMDCFNRAALAIYLP